MRLDWAKFLTQDRLTHRTHACQSMAMQEVHRDEFVSMVNVKLPGDARNISLPEVLAHHE